MVSQTLLVRIAQFMTDLQLTDLVSNGCSETFGQSQGQFALKKIDRLFDSNEQMRQELAQLALDDGVPLNMTSPIAELTLDVATVGRLRIHATLGFGVSEIPLLSVRRHPARRAELHHLEEVGFMSHSQLQRLKELVDQSDNFLISGRTGVGKTTLLGAMLAAFAGRTILIEETLEIGVESPGVHLTPRTSNLEGAGAISIQQLLLHSLRMLPDRVVVGEVRGAELATLLQALNNGHRGSGATIHAASPKSLADRLILLGMLAGLSPDLTARLVTGGVDVVIQLGVIDQRRQIVEFARPKIRHGELEIEAEAQAGSLVLS